MSEEKFDLGAIEVEEYDLGGAEHAAAPIAVFIVSPKTTTVSTVLAADNGQGNPGDEGSAL